MSEKQTRLPWRFWQIVSAEMAERASFIGVATILAGYSAGPLGLSDTEAASLVSAFFTVTYLAPLAGGWVSDRLAGPGRTMISASVLCLAGHAVLGTALDGPWPLAQALSGLGCIALGAGAIKAVAPVLAGAAAARSPSESPPPPRAFGIFYAAINIAALVASLGMPLLRDQIGYGPALVVPMVALALAIPLLWRLPPVQQRDLAGNTPSPRLPRTLIRLMPALSLYYLVLYQGYGSWVLFIGREVDLVVAGWHLPPEIFLAINPLVVITLAPFVEPLLARWMPSHPTRILSGLAMAAIGPAIMALGAMLAASGLTPGPLWPATATLAMALAEVLIAVSALALAAGSGNPAARGRATGMFYLTIAIGNLAGGLLVGVLSVPHDARGFLGQTGLLAIGFGLGWLALRRHAAPLSAPEVVR